MFSETLTLNLSNVFNVIVYPSFFFFLMLRLIRVVNLKSPSDTAKYGAIWWDFAAVREGQTDNHAREVVFKLLREPEHPLLQTKEYIYCVTVKQSVKKKLQWNWKAS